MYAVQLINCTTYCTSLFHLMSSRVNQLSSSPPMGVIISIVPLYCHKKKYLLSLWHHCFQQSDTDCCDQYITSQHVVRWREINESRAPELKLLALKVNDQWSHPCVWFHFRSPNSLCSKKYIQCVLTQIGNREPHVHKSVLMSFSIDANSIHPHHWWGHRSNSGLRSLEMMLFSFWNTQRWLHLKNPTLAAIFFAFNHHLGFMSVAWGGT